MSDPYLGELKLISFNFAPKGWAFCNGQPLPINQNQALFSILGTFYGGDGITNFKLPNLQGRVPVHQGQGFTVGAAGGEAAHTLTINEMPTHNHVLVAQTAANTGSPANAVLASSPDPIYATTPDGQLAPGAIGTAGGSQPHENRPPFLVLNWIIALQGLFPTRN